METESGVCLLPYTSFVDGRTESAYYLTHLLWTAERSLLTTLHIFCGRQSGVCLLPYISFVDGRAESAYYLTHLLWTAERSLPTTLHIFCGRQSGPTTLHIFCLLYQSMVHSFPKLLYLLICPTVEAFLRFHTEFTGFNHLSEKRIDLR